MNLAQIKTAIAAKSGDQWQDQSLGTKFIRALMSGGAALSNGNTNMDSEKAWIKDLCDSINAL